MSRMMLTPARSAAALAALGAALFCAGSWNASAVHATGDQPAGAVLGFASPVEMLFSPDGSRLYVLCQDSSEVRVLDAATYAPQKSIPVGHVPRGFSLSADGKRLFVANSWDDTVTVIDTTALAVTATWTVGREPINVVESRDGKRVFVANRISNDVAVLDASTGAEEKRLAGGRGASYMTLSPDRSRIYVTSIYPDPTSWRAPSQSEVTVIDADKAVAVENIPLRDIAGVFHVAFSADGRLGVVAEMHPKNLVPLTSVAHGSAISDSLTLFGAAVGNKPVEVPLDELDRFAMRPYGVVITPDKQRLYVSSGGSEIVTVIDLPRLLRYIQAHPASFAEDLSASANYVVARIPVGHDARGILLTRDGRHLLVANRLDDTISVIDTRSNRVVSTVPLMGSTQMWALHSGLQTIAEMSGPAAGKTRCADCHIDEKHRSAPKMELSELKKVMALRRGEQTFYTAHYGFHGSLGCASCHIDSTFDALQWDLEPDGLGRNVVDNRLLEDIKDTGPFKWNGGNPNIPTECGPRTEKYFWRSENYDDKTLADLTAYVNSLPLRPNRWSRGGEFTPAQERGKTIFERKADNFGKPIPEANRCSTCHGGPLGTNRKSFDIGTKGRDDDSGLIDTPQLINIALTAPYLHDGRAATLEEIWTVYNPRDQHGRTNDLTKDQLNDLIEYLKTR